MSSQSVKNFKWP